LAFVHHETTSGILNDARAIASAAKQARLDAGLAPIRVILDSMSAFGAYDVPMSGDGAWPVDFVVSSSNKCIEGVPGFGFTLARVDALEECKGIARTLSLDLHDQWEAYQRTGQFRFTPPVQVLAAFRQALVEHEMEGGSAARLARYAGNYARLVSGMQAIGFKMYVDPGVQGSIIATFLQPEDPAFDFNRLYNSLAANGMVIYPGKLTHASCFRIGSIGRLFESDIDALLGCIEKEVKSMGVAF
jgi:2-aminoethylphosphonate-pyruvate transaminase